LQPFLAIAVTKQGTDHRLGIRESVSGAAADRRLVYTLVAVSIGQLTGTIALEAAGEIVPKDTVPSLLSFTLAELTAPCALLVALPSFEDDVRVVAEAASGPEALAMTLAHRPEVAVLDLEMPGTDGVAVATSLRTELPGCRTMIVTGHGRPGHLKRALAAG